MWELGKQSHRRRRLDAREERMQLLKSCFASFILILQIKVPESKKSFKSSVLAGSSIAA